MITPDLLSGISIGLAGGVSITAIAFSIRIIRMERDARADFNGALHLTAVLRARHSLARQRLCTLEEFSAELREFLEPHIDELGRPEGDSRREVGP